MRPPQTAPPSIHHTSSPPSAPRIRRPNSPTKQFRSPSGLWLLRPSETADQWPAGAGFLSDRGSPPGSRLPPAGAGPAALRTPCPLGSFLFSTLLSREASPLATIFLPNNSETHRECE